MRALGEWDREAKRVARQKWVRVRTSTSFYSLPKTYSPHSRVIAVKSGANSPCSRFSTLAHPPWPNCMSELNRCGLMITIILVQDERRKYRFVDRSRVHLMMLLVKGQRSYPDNPFQPVTGSRTLRYAFLLMLDRETCSCYRHWRRDFNFPTRSLRTFHLMNLQWPQRVWSFLSCIYEPQWLHP